MAHQMFPNHLRNIPYFHPYYLKPMIHFKKLYVLAVIFGWYFIPFFYLFHMVIITVVLVAQSCLTLCDTIDCIAHQAPLSMEFSSQEYCSR